MDLPRQRREAPARMGGSAATPIGIGLRRVPPKTWPTDLAARRQQTHPTASLLAGGRFCFIHRLARRDKTIYVACIGWILLNGAMVIGVLVQR
jgi:hypothetical protein